MRAWVRFMGALEGLKAEGVEFWSYQAITTGNKWDEGTRRRISESDIALVLLSQSYLDSSYCRKTEIRTFLIEEEKRGLIIFPIMLSRCEYERHDWLKSRQIIPNENKNIEEHYGRAERRGPLHTSIIHRCGEIIPGVFVLRILSCRRLPGFGMNNRCQLIQPRDG